MKVNIFIACAGICAAAWSLTSSAAASSVALDAVSRGAYKNTGLFGTGGSGAADGNYLTGSLSDVDGQFEFRSFFGFDLSGVTQTITGASITFTTNGFPSGDDEPSAELGLYNYTGDYAVLVTGHGGVAAFDALGGGVLDGSSLVSLSYATPFVLTVALNASGLADLIAAKGHNIAFGGALIGPLADSDFIWGNSFADPATVLTLTVTAAIPEPQTWTMMLIGLAGLGLASRQTLRGLNHRPPV